MKDSKVFYVRWAFDSDGNGWLLFARTITGSDVWRERFYPAQAGSDREQRVLSAVLAMDWVVCSTEMGGFAQPWSPRA